MSVCDWCNGFQSEDFYNVVVISAAGAMAFSGVFVMINSLRLRRARI